MLLSLHIENVAIIKQSDIEFYSGFNVLTGETGAGKSIIIDSINLLLGNKNSRDIIRTGCDYAFVSAVFTCFNPEQIKALSQFDIIPDEDGNIIISRKIIKEGRSISKVNGIAVNISVLKDISQLLVAIHGQHDGSKILNPNTHINYLDEYCEIENHIIDYRENYKNIKKIRSKIESLTEIKNNKAELEETLNYKIKELEKADIKIGEYDNLKSLKINAKNNAQIYSSLYNADQLLNSESGGIIENVTYLANELTPIKDLLSGISENIYALEHVKAELDDISKSINTMFSNQEENDLTEDYIEERLYNISKIIGKYGSESEALNSLEKFKKQLSELSDNEFELESAYNEYTLALKELERSAQKLSNIRLTASKEISDEINLQLKELDMPQVKFEIKITRSTNARGGNKYTDTGYDHVEFFISTNVGQELKPLAKIASGGEMSRIMLCLKTVLNKNKYDYATVIYDEIDSGVSGATAQKIGYKLKKTAFENQVFCITHLAQIASLADNHYKVSKKAENGSTVSAISLLNKDERRYEIARIMGGTDITEQLLISADELINSGNF